MRHSIFLEKPPWRLYRHCATRTTPFLHPLLVLSYYLSTSPPLVQPCIPAMNPRELVDHIRCGPAELVLDEPLRFRRRTRSNPCDFNEFLQALQSSETIRDVTCGSRLELEISEDEWVLLVETLGSIRDIQKLWLDCSPGSRDFHPFQAAADAVNNAQSLREFLIGVGGETFPSDSSGLTALASALQEHTGLQDFRLIDWSRTIEGTSLDPVLRALSACPHLQRVDIMTKCASADATKNLLHLRKDTHLILETDHWLAVADEIRQGRCNIKHLFIHILRSSSSEDTEVVKAIASAIRLDRNLETLVMQTNNNFTDESGVVLAEALTVNETLRKVILSVDLKHPSRQVQDPDILSVPAYEAFCAMLRVNTSIHVDLPALETTGVDERLRDSYKQMVIEQVLNYAGRGRLLSSSRTTKKEWVDALNELNSFDEEPEFTVDFLYSLLRLNPSLCLEELNDTTNSSL
jgi:hypothetical protein